MLGRIHYNSLEVLSSRIASIKDKIETISHLTGHNLSTHNLRSKRGLFDGASYAFNWLFGIPDASDAKFYEESISQMCKDENNTKLLMKKQIAIVSSTIQNFNFSIQNLKENENKLNENIQMFNNFSIFTTESLDELRAQQIISDQILLLTELTSDLNEYYNSLISSITLARHNILHPQILSPKNLYKELSYVVLENDLKLPFPVTYTSIHKYIGIAKLGVVYINEKLIFAIKIPLVERIPYNLYEILPLPIPHNHSSLYSYIEPDSPYILMSTNKGYYVKLQNLEKCITVNTMEYICFLGYATRSSGNPTCETILFTNTVTKIPSSCRTRTVQADFELWHKIQNNRWIFTITNPLQLTLTCSSTHIEDLELQSTGIIQINPNCKGYTQTFIIEAENDIIRNYTDKIILYNITEDECCYRHKNNASIIPVQLTPIKLTNIKSDEFKYANHKLMQLDAILQKQLNEPNTIQHYQGHTIILSLIGSLIGIIVTINLLRCLGILSLLQRLFCCTRNPRTANDPCCLKIFNTNINTTRDAVPVVRTHLSQIMEEDHGSHESEESTSTTTPRQAEIRRSTSRAPSVRMD